MTTTNTYGFDPALDEIFAEAFENAGVEPGAIGGKHVKSATRSLKFMLQGEWATLGVRQWMIHEFTQAVTAGMTDFALPAGAIDIIDAVLRRDGKDAEMNRISRNEYLVLVDKTRQGRPDRFFTDRQAGAPRVRIYECGQNTTDVIAYNCFRQIQDVGSLSSTLQIPGYAHDALMLGLAARLALKFSPAKFATLQTLYRGNDPDKPGAALKHLLEEDRDKSDIQLVGLFEPRTRGWA